MSRRRAVKGGGQREGDQPPNPVQNYRGVREIENVLPVVKTSKLEMRRNMLPSWPADPYLLCLCFCLKLCHVWYFPDSPSVTATGIRGGVRWLGGVEGFPSQRRGTKRLCCCFASSFWWYLIAKSQIKFSAHRVCIQIQSLQPQLGVSSGGKKSRHNKPSQVRSGWFEFQNTFNQSVSQSL